MPARSYSSTAYRFGFQGQEKDDEIKGDGLSINYKYRMHDPRVGRFFSVDPLASEYPWNSPYAFSENRVIDGVELEGLEFSPYSSLPLWVQNVIPIMQDAESIMKGTGKGAEQIAHDMAIVRPADENDPETFEEWWMNIKNMPENIYNLPENLINEFDKVYNNGTLEEKAELTVATIGFIAAAIKGKPKANSINPNLVKAGFNSKTRVLSFIQGTKNKVMREVKVPDGFEKVTISGSKADVFKQKGKNVWITPDLDGHTGGTWKRATDKAENLFKKETREGTYNADLTKRIAD